MAQEPKAAAGGDATSSAAPITRFASSFKAYGLGLGVVVAAIPLATKGTELLPAFASVKSTLAFLTSLVSLLAVALLFGLRRLVGARVFPAERFLSPEDWRRRMFLMIVLPAAFIAVALGSVVGYLATMASSVESAALEFAVGRDEYRGQTLDKILETDEKRVRGQAGEQGPGVGHRVEAFLFDGTEPAARVLGEWCLVEEDGNLVARHRVHFRSEDSISMILERTPSFEIPGLWWIQVLYLLMFLSGAVTFVWFGIIEYIQQELKIGDAALLRQPYCRAALHHFRIESVNDLDENPAPIHFQFAYNPEKFTMVGDGGARGTVLHASRLPAAMAR